VPRQRLGVALLIPPPTSIEIDALRRALGVDDTDRIAPHLTLIPPVNVREDELDAGVEVLRAAAGSCPPLRLQLGPVTTFAPVSPTVHLAVDGDVEPLRALRDAVFVAPLARSLKHDFVPHVTLLEECDHIDAVVRALPGYHAEIVVDRVKLEGSVDLVGCDGRVFDAEEGARILAARAPRPDLAPDPALPAETRLWAALQNASGGTWGGCIFDTDAIVKMLSNGRRL
jgi:2'-5' RNA ligase